jgi:murein DD-endopeptidase MepM/ murein hydrolase activator NlpD
MRRHRTTARGALFLFLVAGLLAGTAAARSGGTTKPIVFPVLGAARYADDFGDPRPGGPHQGIDMVAAKKSLALAAEAGKVKFWTTSATAGCMLYLYGASGTTYYYIHLNNDLTRGNDDRGKCVAGTAYATGLKDGAKVAAGQPVGFVGDSGDAEGAHAHLHFEVHPVG